MIDGCLQMEFSEDPEMFESPVWQIDHFNLYTELQTKLHKNAKASAGHHNSPRDFYSYEKHCCKN